MYTPGGGGRVFDVKAVETVKQDVPCTWATSPDTVQITRAREAAEQVEYPWTVFFLSEVGAIETVAPVIQQGRYVTISDVRKAMASGKLLVLPLDKAFPLRK
ncbi:hypothetical protein [Streptomyces sp. ST2-7A]|uniref:hypothetical protein n=1 Tax=Streptomyces sp. ST2-7A TaxID=2907214 RepID=UPI001F2C7040|nr:hypothetical protein [Streptomyces sp. ST2-7A]MCE7082919.1 hypothetical protein [Streptomyces sp. ST2-7A]